MSSGPQPGFTGERATSAPKERRHERRGAGSEGDEGLQHAVYECGAGGRFAAHSLHALTLARDAISTMTLFVEPRLVLAFGLPPVLPDTAR